MQEFSRRNQVFGLAFWLLASFSAAAVGALASVNSREFYQSLDRPSWAPPGWVFGPVWTVLYAVQGVAAWLVWRQRGVRGARVELGLFAGQLILNAIWTWLFFQWRLGAVAFGEIIVLAGMICATVVVFWRVRPLAGGLLIPYLLWVLFACALAYSIWRRNLQLLG